MIMLYTPRDALTGHFETYFSGALLFLSLNRRLSWGREGSHRGRRNKSVMFAKICFLKWPVNPSDSVSGDRKDTRKRECALEHWLDSVHSIQYTSRASMYSEGERVHGNKISLPSSQIAHLRTGKAIPRV